MRVKLRENTWVIISELIHLQFHGQQEGLAWQRGGVGGEERLGWGECRPGLRAVLGKGRKVPQQDRISCAEDVSESLSEREEEDGIANDEKQLET